jgi:hypothetical protein
VSVRNILSIVTILVCAPCIRAVPASAQGNSEVTDFSLSVADDTQHAAVTEKGYFIYEMSAGSASEGNLLVKNLSDKPVEVQLAVVPALTAQNGGSTFGSPGSGNAGPATWVTLDQDSLSLQPGEASSSGFRVRVPSGVRPGQYLAGVAAYKPKTEVTQRVSSGQNQASAILEVQMRYVIAVQVNVPGAWNAEMSISDVGIVEQPSGASLGLHLKNSGDVLLRPTGTLKVSDESGNTVVEGAINMGTFVTGTEVRYRVPWPSAPKPGNYNVRVVLNYGDGKTTTYDRQMVVEAPQDTAPAPPAANPQNVQAPAAGGNTNANQLPAQAMDTARGIEPSQSWLQYALAALLLAMVLLLGANLIIGRKHAKRY